MRLQKKVTFSAALGSLAFSALLLASGKVFGLAIVIPTASILALMVFYPLRSTRSRTWTESFLFGTVCADLALMVLDYLMVEVLHDPVPALAPGPPLAVQWARVALWLFFVALLCAFKVVFQGRRDEKSW